MLALVLDETHTAKVTGLVGRWVADGIDLHAPVLAKYEVSSAMARKRVRGELSPEETDEGLAILQELDVTFDSEPDTARAVEIAVELKRHSAYDAAYLALAERLDAEVWTLDGPLSRNAGVTQRVNLIE